MEYGKRSILIVDPDASFREELLNFLLSAGYKDVEAVSSLEETGVKIERSAYDVIIADAGSSFAKVLNFSRSIVDSYQNAVIILMIQPEAQNDWNHQPTTSDHFKMLIKPTFPQDLLYLIEECVPNELLRLIGRGRPA